ISSRRRSMRLRLMGIGADVDIGGGVLIHGFVDHSGLVMCISVIQCSPITPQIGLVSGSVCVTISVSKSVPTHDTTRSRMDCVADAARAAGLLGGDGGCCFSRTPAGRGS